MLKKVEQLEPITQKEEILPDIDQALIDQLIPEIKQEDEVNFNETLKAVRIEKVQEIAALVGHNPKLIQPVNDVLKEAIDETIGKSDLSLLDPENSKSEPVTEELEEVMEDTIDQSEMIPLDTENAYVIGECSQSDGKLPDDFDVDMIDQTLNTLMCSKRDLATNHAVKHETFLRIFKHCEGVLTSDCQFCRENCYV